MQIIYTNSNVQHNYQRQQPIPTLVTNTTPDKDDTLDPNAPPNACDEGDGVIHMDKEDRE